MMMNPINEAIFREYDIRGIVKNDLPDEVVQRIASAYARVFIREGKQTIAVAMDGRPSSPHLKEIVINNLVKYGLHVTDIGLVPTPVLYYAIFKLGFEGGIIITASHNPAEYNGFKAMVGREAQSGAQIKEIYTLAENKDFPEESEGRRETRNIIDDYLEFIAADIKMEKKLKVVVDCGNGTGGITAIPLYRMLGVDLEVLYGDVDGHFPNHHPDPTKQENLQDLLARVDELKADVGIGFDGDADRIGVVDGSGNILWGDQLTQIFARDILASTPGAKIISEVKASETLYQEIADLGGIPIMWKTGHSLIKKKIAAENAALAGEVSGHIFFNDRWFGFDDAVYAGARLLELLSRSEKSLPEIYSTLPSVVNTPEIRVDTQEEAKFVIVNRIVEHFKKSHEVIDIDGARIKFDNGWALVRASNTQPSLVLRFEADTQEHLQEIQDHVNPILSQIRSQVEK
jgi:phosphomannomutase/phosphoglucomutase